MRPTIAEQWYESSSSLNRCRNLVESLRGRGLISWRSRVRCSLRLCRSGSSLGLRRRPVLLETFFDEIEMRAPVQSGVVDITITQPKVLLDSESHERRESSRHSDAYAPNSSR